MDELKLINYLKNKFRVKKSVIMGIGDDCAVISYTPSKYMLLTTDMIVEGTHFTKNARPYEIGWKAIAVNISDIASMGGLPKYALLSAGIPRTKGIRFIKEITKGVAALCNKFDISVIGGDTNLSAKIVLNVTLLGEVEKNRFVTRNGAKPGDMIFVTGALGEGKAKHLNFTPRIKEARILTDNFKISSMIDLSDGLAMDLNRLTNASKTGAFIYKSLIPLSERSLCVDRAIKSGEDFELLFTVPLCESRKIIKRMGKKRDLPVTLIGEVVHRRFGVNLIGDEGKVTRLKPDGYRHF